jgi:Fe2+ or Zn2+ uptake regulation protein
VAQNNKINDELHLLAARRLRAAGMRYSKSRKAIVEVLASAGKPLTLDEVLAFKSDNNLAQSSVYRNSTELVEAGVVKCLALGKDHNRFELDDSIIGHHHHFVCLDCGDIADFEVPEYFEKEILRLEAELVKKGLSVDGHTLDIQGRCYKCS